MKWILTCGLVGAVSLAWVESVSAQPPAPARRPTISPYLELLRNNQNGGRGIGFDYYRRLRPQQELQERLSTQNLELRSLQNQLNTVEALGQSLRQRDRELLGTTGHPTQFMSTGGYFSGIGGR
ncbi:hypothetical protein Mal4_03390 [Maioricimonas rarisocia]|uniref:Uncharacterized protein n=1 Tax=Maioricimonas rarisocia TaxID=2528026 RepID=A0A517Z0P4_9PLAN|nr:hypothetical protein [Maioricimonas rarisocia]QDU36056.1 hypothetical protein Mal4_03390 [Maioricimonas rarisocia]